MADAVTPQRSAGLPSVAQAAGRAAAGRACLYVPPNGRFASKSVSRAQAKQGAVFLDRDGVIIEDVHFLTSPAQIRVLPGVSDALGTLQGQFSIIVVTNQSGVARGLLSKEDLQVIHEELARRLAAKGAVVDAVYYCPHLPEATIDDYRLECECRKPKPGMLLQAQEDWGIDLARSYVIGDRARDIHAGIEAGVRSILVGDQGLSLQGVYDQVTDLAQAAQLILDVRSRR